MKILFDLLPIVLFFAAFKLADIYVATAVAIVATAALIGWTWLKTRKVDPMQWVSLGLIVVFGGPPSGCMMKPSSNGNRPFFTGYLPPSSSSPISS